MTTVTSMVPAAVAAGVATVISVVETTAKPERATESKSTAVVPVKLLPVIVTVVPPLGTPAAGLTVLTVGAVW